MSFKASIIPQLAETMRPPFSAINVPKTRLVIAESFITMLIEGPLVSFNGSPTVSPITAALCSSVVFPSSSFLRNTNGATISPPSYA
jgi:hypothetical protein